MRMITIGLLLSGCTVRDPEVRIVRVEVPISVPCLTLPIAEPIFAATSLKKSDSLQVKVRALLAERRQRMAYEKNLLL